MALVCSPEGWIDIDCSPEGLARYRLQLAGIEDKLYSGVSSVSDRSRSVSYHNPNYLEAMARRLRWRLAYCAGCRRASRLSYTPLIKAL
jgi:hypothetical protein